MIIPLSVIYYLYLIVIVFFILGSLFNIYHLIRFGFASLANLGVILLFIIIASSIVLFSINSLQSFDWEQPLIDTTQNTISNDFSI